MGSATSASALLSFFAQVGDALRQGADLPAGGSAHAPRRHIVPHSTLHRPPRGLRQIEAVLGRGQSEDVDLGDGVVADGADGDQGRVEGRRWGAVRDEPGVGAGARGQWLPSPPDCQEVHG